MRALALEHLHSNTVGIYGDVLLDHGIEVNPVRLDLGEPLPNWSDYDLLVVMGGGMSAYEEDLYPWLAAEKRTIREAVTAGRPYFGVCLGSQLLASALGSRVFKGPEPELGVNPVFLCDAARSDPVFRGFPPDVEVFEWHSDTFDLPDGAVRLARSSRYENQAYRVGQTAYAIQCHLETTLKDVRHWFEAWPSLGETFETRYGRGSLAEFLKEYERSMPLLQQTARQLFRRWLENAMAYGRSSAALSGAAKVILPDSRLLGREREKDQIGRMLARARSGRGGMMVIHGEIGIGKTALLDDVLDGVQGMRVIRISGSEGMADRPYAGVEQLCRPFLAGVSSLPASLRQALEATLGLATAENSDRLFAYAGTLWLLAAAAEKEPLLVCIDDAHLLDDASLHALGFIAGRLEAEGIALIIATSGDYTRFKEAEVMELPPLDRANSLIHLRRIFGDQLSPTVVTEVVHIARGNPLGLLEIPLSLTPDQRTGRVSLDNALHTRGSAERAILSRIGMFGEDTRRGLLVLALGHELDKATFTLALQLVGASPEALKPAVEAALVEAGEGQFLFRHPLVRSSVIYGALRSERRAAHAALAKATKPDASIWHAARAAPGPDEAIAAALESVAERLIARMANLVASRALELSSRLTPDRGSRARRLVAAAEAAARAGHIYAAIDHVEAALPELDDVGSRAAADLLLGRLFARSGSAARARDLLVKGAARCEASDRPKAGRLLAAAVMPALRAGTPVRACEIAREALELSKDGPTEAAATIVLGTALDIQRRSRERPRSSAARRRIRWPTPERSSNARLSGRWLSPRRRTRSCPGHPHAIDQKRSLARGVRPASLCAGTHSQCRDRQGSVVRCACFTDGGRFACTRNGAGRGTWVSLWARSPGSMQLRGEPSTAAITPARRSRSLSGSGQGSRLDRAVPALGLLALGSGELNAAIEHFTEVRKMQLEQGWCDAAVFPHHARDLIEGLIGAGRTAEAEREASIFEREVRQTKRPSAQAALACCRALLANPDKVDGLFRESLRYGTRGGRPVRARPNPP